MMTISKLETAEAEEFPIFNRRSNITLYISETAGKRKETIWRIFMRYIHTDSEIGAAAAG